MLRSPTPNAVKDDSLCFKNSEETELKFILAEDSEVDCPRGHEVLLADQSCEVVHDVLGVLPHISGKP